MKTPKILALDFDGVICNGVFEYFQSSKKTYNKIWSEYANNEYAQKFYKLRPVIEHGWEMPVLLRAIILGYSEEEILDNWQEIASKIVSSENLNISQITQELDQVRDNWINSNLDEWLSLQTPYQGVIEKVKKIIKSGTILYIISTKEGRFIGKFLQRYNVPLSQVLIIGKECKQPKYETLRLISNKEKVDASEIWFVEDRLKTLNLVAQQPYLKNIQLYLADWGYNTQKMRETAQNEGIIKILSLNQFCQDLSQW